MVLGQVNPVLIPHLGLIYNPVIFTTLFRGTNAVAHTGHTELMLRMDRKQSKSCFDPVLFSTSIITPN